MSNELIRVMFKHLVKTYSVEQAREILVTKYPNSKELIMSLESVEPTVDETVGAVSEGALEKVKKAVKEKTAKPKVVKPAKEKAESKMDKAKALYAELEDKTRKNVIAQFVEQIGLTQAAASTYYYNIKKAE